MSVKGELYHQEALDEVCYFEHLNLWVVFFFFFPLLLH